MTRTFPRRTPLVCAAALVLASGLAACATTGTERAAPAVAETDPWRVAAEDALATRLAVETNHARAKNVIVFIADGASPTLFTAARIHDGQRMGEIGDTHDSVVDRMPHTAFAKTHSTDNRIPDSAATATAIFTGVKTRNGAVGVRADSITCEATLADPTTNIAEFARETGRKVGVITTSTVVDASPAAVFAHAPTRRWDAAGMVNPADRAAGCRDLPEQLVAADLDVVFGGGLALFTPKETGGARPDGRDLVAEWRSGGEDRVFVSDGAGLSGLAAASGEKVLGLFSPEEMFADPARTPQDPTTTTPTLAEMTAAAIARLEASGEGYVLMIEHEGTDEFQHAGLIRRTLDSGAEYFEAISTALDMVDLDETLVVVTADHGQPLAFAGSAPLDAPLIGVAQWNGETAKAQDGAPFSVLGFYVGPHGRVANTTLSDADLLDPTYIPDAAVPTGYVTHSAVDVPVYAAGPWSDLFAGVMEQNVIFAILRHAMEPAE